MGGKAKAYNIEHFYGLVTNFALSENWSVNLYIRGAKALVRRFRIYEKVLRKLTSKTEEEKRKEINLFSPSLPSSANKYFLD